MEKNLQPLDYTPLQEKVTYMQGAKQLFGSNITYAVTTLLLIYVLIVFGLTYLLDVWVSLLLGATLTLVALLYGLIRARTDVATKRFVNKNGLVSITATSGDLIPAATLDVGFNHKFVEGVRADDGSWLIGNYRFSSVQSKQDLYFGVACVRLNGQVPHLLLSSRQYNINQLLEGFDASFSRDQILHLEGDFQNYFETFALEGQQISTLSTLTPDVMATFIDNGAAFSFELVGQYLVLLTHRFNLHQTNLQPTIEAHRNILNVIAAEINQNIHPTTEAAKEFAQQAGAQRLTRHVEWLAPVIFALTVIVTLVAVVTVSL